MTEEPVESTAAPAAAAIDPEAVKAQAAAYHAQGYNCAQAVMCALAPHLGCDVDTAFRLMEGFGLGMGGMSETCGALSGAVAALGMANSAGAASPTSKGATYRLSREAARRFRAKNSSTVCHELKGVDTDHGMLRSCPGCIDDAVDIAVDLLNARA